MSNITSLAWLPRDAIAAAAERLPVREAVSDWAAKWFARGGASLSGYAAVGADAVAAGNAFALDDGLMLAIPDQAITAIGISMFGAPDDAATAADRAAIDAAARQALTDFRQRAADLAGLPRDAGWRACDARTGEPGYRFILCVGQASLTLTVADRLLIAGIKARLRPVAAAAPIGAIAAGLAPHPITLSARLGTCHLSTSQLVGLAAGDVVVLDRGLSDPADLVIDHGRQSAACTIAAGTDHLDLTLA